MEKKVIAVGVAVVAMAAVVGVVLKVFGKRKMLQSER